jgi:hypothetical protein
MLPTAIYDVRRTIYDLRFTIYADGCYVCPSDGCTAVTYSPTLRPQFNTIESSMRMGHPSAQSGVFLLQKSAGIGGSNACSCAQRNAASGITHARDIGHSSFRETKVVPTFLPVKRGSLSSVCRRALASPGLRRSADCYLVPGSKVAPKGVLRAPQQLFGTGSRTRLRR